MAMQFDYQREREADDEFLEGDDAAPVSGIHHSHGFRFDERFTPDSPETQDGVEVYVSDFPLERRIKNGDAPAATQSWIGALLSQLKAKISTPPPATVEKEFIPMDEQDLLTMVEIEERSLELHRMIVENREALMLNALAAGMTVEDLRNSDDARLDPVLTDAWNKRLEEKIKVVDDLRAKAEKKRSERLLRNSMRPPVPFNYRSRR